MLGAMRMVYTYDMHKNVILLRDYLPSKFALNEWLTMYLFLLDILLGKTVEITENIQQLLHDFTAFRGIGYIFALMVLNKNMHQYMKSVPNMPSLLGVIPYSEIVYDVGYIENIRSHKHKLLMSIWLAGRQAELNWPIPIVELYFDVEADGQRIIASTRAYRNISYKPNVPIKSLEAAAWLLQYFEFKYLLLQPVSYFNYIAMRQVWPNLDVNPKVIQKLKANHEQQVKLFTKLKSL